MNALRTFKKCVSSSCRNAQQMSRRTFAAPASNVPPDFRTDGFPILDPDHPDYDPLRDPFNPLAETWTMQGPFLIETDWDDPKRLDAIVNIPPQGKTATEQPVFRTVVRTIREFHRAPPEDVPVEMSSRFVEDLGFDSLDINELAFYWEHEFCQWPLEIDDHEVWKWQTVGDVVTYICGDPRYMVNVQSTEGMEFYYWEPFNQTYRPNYTHFTDRIDNEGNLSEKCLNPSGIPEFAPRLDGISKHRRLPPDVGVIDDTVRTYDFGPAGLGGACQLKAYGGLGSSAS